MPTCYIFSIHFEEFSRCPFSQNIAVAQLVEVYRILFQLLLNLQAVGNPADSFVFGKLLRLSEKNQVSEIFENTFSAENRSETQKNQTWRFNGGSHFESNHFKTFFFESL